MKGYMPRPHPEGELKSICLFTRDDLGSAKICVDLPTELEAVLVSILRKNADLLTWSQADMGGVLRKVMEYRLAVKPD